MGLLGITPVQAKSAPKRKKRKVPSLHWGTGWTSEACRSLPVNAEASAVSQAATPWLLSLAHYARERQGKRNPLEKLREDFMSSATATHEAAFF